MFRKQLVTKKQLLHGHIFARLFPGDGPHVTILKWILREWVIRMWVGFIFLGIEQVANCHGEVIYYMWPIVDVCVCFIFCI
jgi:hypothetical protein